MILSAKRSMEKESEEAVLMSWVRARQSRLELVREQMSVEKWRVK